MRFYRILAKNSFQNHWHVAVIFQMKRLISSCFIIAHTFSIAAFQVYFSAFHCTSSDYYFAKHVVISIHYAIEYGYKVAA